MFVVTLLGLVHTTLYSLALGGIFGYLLGSVPTAFLIVRWTSDLDIRKAGSGNVGTLNSYQVTKSKVVGVFVLILDFLKGFAPVMILLQIGGSTNWGAVAGAGVGAVVGHNFPVWLRFRGGRGLATAAGVLTPLCISAIVVWGITWGIGFLASRAVNVANGIATLLLLILLWVFNDSILGRFVAENVPATGFRWFGTALLIIILVKHVRPVMNFISKK